MSKILDNLGLDYRVNDVQRDGNCFYHAVSKQLNSTIPFHALRQIIANNVNDEDLSIFNAINDTQFSKNKLMKKLKKCGTDCIWADAVEINILSREIPHIGIMIFDEECGVINKIEQDSFTKRYIFLKRQNYHYQSIELSEMNKKRLLRIMKHTDNYTIESSSPQYYNSIIGLISFWIIFFQFFDRSLKNR